MFEHSYISPIRGMIRSTISAIMRWYYKNIKRKTDKNEEEAPFIISFSPELVIIMTRNNETLKHGRVSIGKITTIIIIIFLHGLGRLTCSGINVLPSFPRASTISSSSRFVVEGVFRDSGIVHSSKMVDPVLFVFGSHVLCSCVMYS